MNIQSLNGQWQFKSEKDKEYKTATVPGSNFTDLLAVNAIPDPFIDDNEKAVQWVARETWVYKKNFIVDESIFNSEKVELVANMLDTLATVYFNSEEIASTNNINRTYVFDIKEHLVLGENEIQIVFSSPFTYINQRQKLLKLPHNSMGVSGCPHVRKTPCHFGWDFGPTLIPCGISRDIFLRGYSVSKIVDFQAAQEHFDGKVKLIFTCLTSKVCDRDVFCRVDVTTPSGELLTQTSKVVNNEATLQLEIENSQLWWCTGLGEQPLYGVSCTLLSNEIEEDNKTIKLGLRTIQLNTDKDKYGRNFCFVVNGVEIFAKGANWIPADSFNTRVTEEKLQYLLGAFKDANMNLIRVWGGGYYESDIFYDLCDKLGILVWQDMSFACSAYPFDLEDFRENISHEVKDNVCRLRHHASLCLWCGNNEIESMSLAWSYRRDIIKSTGNFFYNTLPAWIKEFDKSTAYWGCTPSSGEYMKNVNSDDFGDTHLWNVWHGMRNTDFYRKRYTRFCSEFGLESYPSKNCFDTVIPNHEYRLKDSLVNAHQKCGDGDTKMLYYVNKRFWEPKKFDDLIYLTQLTQMECIRDATEHWRRHRERCHGALYWQFNDIWGGTSWSSMDYFGNYKALLYKAKEFNENVALSLENKWFKINMFTINDTTREIKAHCKWRLELFNDDIIQTGELDCVLPPLKAQSVAKFDFKNALSMDNKKHAVFVAELFDEKGDLISKRRSFIYRERQSPLPKAHLKTYVTLENGVAKITVSTDRYARFVCLSMDKYSIPFSDNYFDLSFEERKTVTINVPKEWTRLDVEMKLSVMSLCDVTPQMSRTQDRIKEFFVMIKPVNVINWIGRLFDK